MRLGPVLALLLSGCAVDTVDTPSTEGLPPDQVARLRVPAHHERLRGFTEDAHLRAVIIDGVRYNLDGETTEFRLRPGARTIDARYEACIHWPETWFRSRYEVHINHTDYLPLTAEPGRVYQLHCAVGWNSGPWAALLFKKVE